MGKFDNISDEELIARLRDGETIIEDYLMEKYKGLVRQKARAMFLIGGDTDDLIQEGMIGLFKAVRDFQPGREATFATFHPEFQPPEASAFEFLCFVEPGGREQSHLGA